MKLSEEDMFNFIKCAEELNELSALLIHQVLTPEKQLMSRLSQESGDALYWLWKIISETLDEDLVKEQLEKKGDQYGKE